MIQPTLPDYDYSLVIRTDFSDDAGWQTICRLVKAPQPPYGFQAAVECIDASECEGLTPETIRSVLPPAYQTSVVFLVDARTVAQPDHPVLVVDLSEGVRTFRVIPSEAWAVENNLRIANMSFEDFAEVLDDDGVFRGFTVMPE